METKNYKWREGISEVFKMELSHNKYNLYI